MYYEVYDEQREMGILKKTFLSYNVCSEKKDQQSDVDYHHE